MTETPLRRHLPLLPAHPGGRSALTCRYRCGDACFHEVPNTSDNTYFGDVVAEAISRRSVLKAGAVIAAAGAATTLIGAPAAATGRAAQGRQARPSPVGLRFEAIDPDRADRVVVPGGYVSEVVIRWGDPLFPDSPEFDPENQTAAAQAKQFGFNNDHLGLFALGHGEYLMVVNHEYTDEPMMFRDYDPANPTREQVEIAWAAHGLTIVAATDRSRGRRSRGLDILTDHRLNRRFTATDRFEMAGPAAGSELLRTTADPEGRHVLGTLNNCAGGLTPWNTWLTAEENFNQYFGNAGALSGAAYTRAKRYGIGDGASGRKWERFDDRFDLGKEPNEVNRFGWIVEVDPFDPSSTPKKRTALGRFKHEAATVRLAPGRRPVIYMGDDERFDYLYKFVSRDAFRNGDAAHNATLLDNGTLYVAKLTADGDPAEDLDGTGEWIALATSADGTVESHVPGMTGEEVLVFTRLAGDKVGATKMDRPEDVEPSPKTGLVYVALTNNTARQAPEPGSPRPSNKHGHVIELDDTHNPAGTAFTWRIFLLCGDPSDPSTYFAGFDPSQVSPISCPDNLAFDPHGNLWISTDGQPGTLGHNDALFGVAVDGPGRGRVKQFLSVPIGAETCGPVVTEDRVMVCVQHPGEVDGASFDNRISNWPDGDGAIPRPAIVVAYRADGKKIGQEA